jgi:hypothetical protein
VGQDVGRTGFRRSDRQRYRVKVRRCLEALAQLVRDCPFDAPARPMTGLELELNLVDGELLPALVNADVLDAVGGDEFTTELGRWNLEINVPPRALPGEAALELERHLLDTVSVADAKAQTLGARVVQIGILPTLRAEDLVSERMSPRPRYELLNEQMLEARGEPFRLDIEGSGLGGREAEHLIADFETIAPEAACTAAQLHLQVPPHAYGAYWNAAQCLASVQLAVGANSPFFLDKLLWAETRIPLFKQACDVRSVELRNQGVRPRVWFGEKWINSIQEQFEENSRYFPALLPICEPEDPIAEIAAGRAPQLTELRLLNGTIWRWNRPVYDTVDGVAHFRLENRVLPAGPTIVDTIANAVFFYGLLRALAEQEQPLWSRLPFEAAEENFNIAARFGMNAALYWPHRGWVRPDQLMLRTLLPLAAEGLTGWGMSTEVADRYLSVIEQRCANRQTGAAWQVGAVEALEGRGLDRPAAICGMLDRYIECMAANEPVHAWKLPRG